MKLSDIYNIKSIKDTARLKLAKWFNEVEELGVDNFYTVIDTFENHYQTILNFFINRATNANAESFNAKVKAFRAQFRGVTDIPFFLYSHPLETIFQHNACTDKLYADSFFKVQKNSHSSFEVICCRS